MCVLLSAGLVFVCCLVVLFFEFIFLRFKKKSETILSQNISDLTLRGNETVGQNRD